MCLRIMHRYSYTLSGEVICVIADNLNACIHFLRFSRVNQRIACYGSMKGGLRKAILRNSMLLDAFCKTHPCTRSAFAAVSDDVSQ